MPRDRSFETGTGAWARGDRTKPVKGDSQVVDLSHSPQETAATLLVQHEDAAKLDYIMQFARGLGATVQLANPTSEPHEVDA